MRIDLHRHTHHSRDSLTSPDAVVQGMDRQGLEMLAITDHNTLAGALDFALRAPHRFLVGDMTNTTHGELIAWFLEEEIPPGLSLEETISQIQAQGGLVGASHPLDRTRSAAVGRKMLEQIHMQQVHFYSTNAKWRKRAGAHQR